MENEDLYRKQQFISKMTIYIEKYDVVNINRPILDIIRPIFDINHLNSKSESQFESDHRDE